MSLSWTLSHRFNKISYREFMQLVTEFKSALEQETKQKSSLFIRTLEQNEFSTNFGNPEIDHYNEGRNQAMTLFSSNDLADLTPQIWENRMHLAIRFMTDGKETPIARMDIRANYPKQVTFSVKEEDPDSIADTRIFMGMATKYGNKIF